MRTFVSLKNSLQLFITLSVMLASVASAETRYVSDELNIYMRNGPGIKYTILKSLKSGDELTLLEESDKGWSRVNSVRHEREGWVLTRQIQKALVARQVLEANAAELEKLKQQHKANMKKLAKQNGDKAKLDIAHTRLKREHAALKNAHEKLQLVSQRTIEIDKKNAQLAIQVKTLQREKAELSANNDALGSSANRDWFMIGAAVLLIGIAVGLIVPRIRWGKRDSWGDSL